MEFARKNPKLAYSISIAIIILVALFNILYFIFAPIQSQGNPKNYRATPILEHPSIRPTITDTTTASTSPLSILSLSILLVIVLLLMVIIFAVLKFNAEQRKKRDVKRREDLKRIAQAFEAYKLEHGLYPLSSTYQPQYYTGINLSKDWNYYGLPDKEHMARFLPDWPVSDPSLDYNAKNQVNQYLYYPKDNGRKFYLYAHLEAPTAAETIDYNAQDNLLRSWGAYNYRVESGQEQPINVEQPHPEHTKPADPSPTQPNTVANEPIMPVTATIPTQPVQQNTQQPFTQAPTAPDQTNTFTQPATPDVQPDPAVANQTAIVQPNIQMTASTTIAGPTIEQTPPSPAQPTMAPSQTEMPVSTDDPQAYTPTQVQPPTEPAPINPAAPEALAVEDPLNQQPQNS